MDTSSDKPRGDIVDELKNLPEKHRRHLCELLTNIAEQRDIEKKNKKDNK